MKIVKKIIKAIFYLVLIFMVLTIILHEKSHHCPYMFSKEEQLWDNLVEAVQAKNFLLLDRAIFDYRRCGKFEIYNQAKELLCFDFNYNNFLKELNEANRTKNKKRLMELDLQSHRCINDKNLSSKIQKEFELYKLYWRNNE